MNGKERWPKLSGGISHRRSRAFRAPGLERLEGRRLLAVTATYDARTHTLSVALSAAGDVAVLAGSNRDITVNGTSFTGVFTVDVEGAYQANQVVDLNGAVNPIDVNVSKVSAVNINGDWRQHSLRIALSPQPGGIAGQGAFTVGADASLDCGNSRVKSVELGGNNNFRGDVSVVGAADVLLKTVDLLKLKALKVGSDATLISKSIQLTGDRNNDSYISYNAGNLTLEPTGLNQSIFIGRTTSHRHYDLSEADLNAFRFDRMTVGRADDQGRVEFGAVQVNHHLDNLTVRTGQGGSIVVDGTITSKAGLTFAAPRATTTLNANVLVAATTGIDFQGPVVVGKPEVVEIGSDQSIQFQGTVDDDAGPSELKILGFGRGVSFGTVGGTTPLARLMIDDGGRVSFGGDVSAGSIDITRTSEPIVVEGAIRTKAGGAPTHLVLNTRSQIVLAGPVLSPDQTIHLTAGAGIAASGAIQAGRIVLAGEGVDQLDSPRNEVDVLSGDIQGPLTFADASALTIHRDEDHPYGLRSSDSISIRSLEALIINATIKEPKGDLVLDAPTVAETPDGAIDAAGLLVQATERVNLKQRANAVGVLAARAAGNVAFRGSGRTLTIGTVAGVGGISSQGSNVLIQNNANVDVVAPIDTTPGTGGQLTFVGDKSKVRLDVQPTLGSGNVTFVVD
jgi:hypothetical protein